MERVTAVETFISLVLNYAIGFPNVLFQGFVLSKLYTWFVLDAFPHAPHLGVINAIGIAIIAGILTTGPADFAAIGADDDDPIGFVITTHVMTFLLCAASLLSGFIWVTIR